MATETIEKDEQQLSAVDAAVQAVTQKMQAQAAPVADDDAAREAEEKQWEQEAVADDAQKSDQTRKNIGATTEAKEETKAEPPKARFSSESLYWANDVGMEPSEIERYADDQALLVEVYARAKVKEEKERVAQERAKLESTVKPVATKAEPDDTDSFDEELTEEFPKLLKVLNQMREEQKAARAELEALREYRKTQEKQRVNQKAVDHLNRYDSWRSQLSEWGKSQLGNGKIIDMKMDAPEFEKNARVLTVAQGIMEAFAKHKWPIPEDVYDMAFGAVFHKEVNDRVRTDITQKLEKRAGSAMHRPSQREVADLRTGRQRAVDEVAKLLQRQSK